MILAIIILTVLVIALICNLFCYLHYHSQINELKRQKGREFEERILIALLSNPERYKYISELVESGKISQEEANKKNIHKAFKIAETFKRYHFESMQKSRQNPELLTQKRRKTMTLSFSQKFKDGTPNFFIEKIWHGLLSKIDNSPQLYDTYSHKYYNKIGERWGNHLTREGDISPKFHTIRRGNRWKAGDKIHFVVNNRTKNRFQFAPVIEVESVQKIEIIYGTQSAELPTPPKVEIDGRRLTAVEISLLAKNDGFNSVEQFFEWFSEDFEGQIIHWTDVNTKKI